MELQCISHTDSSTDYSTLILGLFPLDHTAHVGISWISLKLFGREIIFEVLQPMYLNVTVGRTDGQTDRQTDGQHYNLINCALRSIAR